jgi:hypothetical protein
MRPDELKHKVRQLKEAEMAIRFKVRPFTDQSVLVWNEFFTAKPETGRNARRAVRYPFERLSAMDTASLRNVIDEFFYHVYFRYYQENGLVLEDLYDPRLLGALGLPPQASLADIKKRFRELAMKYHPDRGGDADQFIALVDTYNKLLES